MEWPPIIERYVNLNDYLPRDSFDYVFDGVPTLLYPKKTYVDTAYAILQKVPNITVWKKNEIPEKLVYGKNPRVSDLVVSPHIGTYVQFARNHLPVMRRHMVTIILHRRWRLYSMRQVPRSRNT